MSCSALEVPIKFEIVRNGVVEEVRRRRLVNPSFEVVSKVVKELARGRYQIQYIDEDGDVVTMDTEEEWEECLSLWKQLNTLRIRINLLSSPPRPRFNRREEWWGGRSHCHKGRRWYNQDSDEEKTAKAEEEPTTPPQLQDLVQGAARAWFSAMKNFKEASEEQPNASHQADPWQEAARCWFSGRKNRQGGCRRFKKAEESEEEPANTHTQPDPLQEAARWWFSAMKNQQGQQGCRRETEEKDNKASLELVKKVLDQLFGNGEEVLSRILEGKTDEKTLGCDAWLKIVKQDTGDIDLDVEMAPLSSTLMRYGLQAMEENNKKSAVGLFELCTEVSKAPWLQRTALYNLACAKLMGHAANEVATEEMKAAEEDEALSALESAVKLGYRNFRHMLFDPDLKTIRDNERFKALLPARAKHCMKWAQKYREHLHRRQTEDVEPEPVKSTSSPLQPTASPVPAVAPTETKEPLQSTASPVQWCGTSYGSAELPTEQQKQPTASPVPVVAPTETSPVQSTPPVELPTEQQPEPKYKEQIKMLQDMGLMRPEVSPLVEQFSGDLQQVIAALMQ